MFTQESGAQLPVLRESLGLSGFYFLNFFGGWGVLLSHMTKISPLSPVSISLSKFILCFVVVFKCFMVWNWGSQDKVWVRGKPHSSSGLTGLL